MTTRARAIVIASFIAAGGGWIGGQGQQLPPPPATGTGFLAGQVVESPSGRPVAGAAVTLIGRTAGRGNLPVIADSQGRFFFADLAAGTYQTQAGKPGYNALTLNSFSRAIELTDGQRVVDLKIRIVKLASLTGTVRDDGGDPVVGTDVIAFGRQLVNGRATLRLFSQGRTDDRGVYRISNLRPGDYVVCACNRDPIPFDGLLLATLASEPLQLMTVAARALKVGADAASLDSTIRTYAPTFYPSSATVARASRVTMAPGDEKLNVDIDVIAVRAARVSGTVIGAPSPVQAQSFRLVPAGESDEGAQIVSLAPVLVQADGRFDFAGVPPGQYTLRVTHAVNSARSGGPSGSAMQLLGARGAAMGALDGQPSATEPPLWAAEPVSVGDDGVSGLSIALRRGTSVSGRLQFVGAAPPPAGAVLGRVAIIVQSVNAGPPGISSNSIGRIAADGTFKAPGVVPGRYTIGSTAFPGWPTFKSIMVNGIDVTDLAFEIDANDVTDVVLTFTDSPMATLDGTLAGTRRPSVIDETVLVFPTDRRYWTDPGAASRRFRSSAAGPTGAFTIPQVSAGEYFVLVVADEVAVDWQEATKLETLAKTAQKIQVAGGEKKTIEVKR